MIGLAYRERLRPIGARLFDRRWDIRDSQLSDVHPRKQTFATFIITTVLRPKLVIEELFGDLESGGTEADLPGPKLHSVALYLAGATASHWSCRCSRHPAPAGGGARRARLWSRSLSARLLSHVQAQPMTGSSEPISATRRMDDRPHHLCSRS